MRARLFPLILLTGVLVSSASAGAVATLSERSCLLAWNAASNQANRTKLVAAWPIIALSLRPGVALTESWTKTTALKQTSGEACLLTIRTNGQIQIVTGAWQTGTVTRWSFGRPLPTTNALPGNVRLLSDGRVAKIYRR